MMKHQIDYQKQEVKILSGDNLTEINIPLPINSILKGVSVSKKPTGSVGMFNAVQAKVALTFDSQNSNIRLDHILLQGSIYNSGNYSVEQYYDKSLSSIYDIPIQKEGIILTCYFYNQTGNTQTVNINYIVKNLEGGI